MLEAQSQLTKNLTSEADQLLQSLDLSDKEAWYLHPCTQALIKRLTADGLDIQANWAEGSYTEESSAGTLQRNSKYIGMAMAIDDLLEAIEEIKAKPLEGIDGEPE